MELGGIIITALTMLGMLILLAKNLATDHSAEWRRQSGLRHKQHRRPD